MQNKIKTELIKRFEANGWDKTVIAMKCDGAKIIITPCTMGLVPINKLEDVEWFLMDCTTINTYGSDKIEDICKFIMNYEKELKENEEEIEKCKAYWEKHVKNSTDRYMDDFYSDWHKDLFGYRPRNRDTFPATRR